MTADPAISVLVPAYNRADTLEQCVRSALAGGYANLRVVISDNASTDGTQTVARRLAADDPRITVIEHAVNRGPLPNWGTCLERATGDYVHWLWSDDWVEPGFYRTLVDGMEREGAQMALAAARIICPEAGWSFIGYSNRPNPAHELLRLALEGFHLPQSPASALLPLASVRRHFTDAIPVRGGLDCNRRAIGADALMILGALLDAERVYVHPDPLAFFRAGPTSITTTSGGRVLSSHYAWARLWWSRRHGIPRSWNWADLLRLLRAGHPVTALRALL